MNLSRIQIWEELDAYFDYLSVLRLHDCAVSMDELIEQVTGSFPELPDERIEAQREVIRLAQQGYVHLRRSEEGTLAVSLTDFGVQMTDALAYLRIADLMEVWYEASPQVLGRTG